MIFKQVILLLLVGVLLVALWGWRPTAEGFSDTPSQSSPLEDWINYFHYRLATPNKYRDDTNVTESALKNRKEIPLDPSIPLNLMNDAMATPMSGGSEKDNDVSRFFYHADTGELTTADKQCRRLPHPRSIGPRSGESETATGCGWWYVEDPNTASTGAFGSVAGPEAPATTLPVGGRWVWDVAEATKLESIKRCRRIRTCNSIAGTTGECGFCTETNRGVPVTSAGTVAYPTDPYGSCGTAPVTDATRCPPIQYNLVVDRYDFNYDANGNVIDGEDTKLMRLIERDGMGRMTGVCDTDSAGRISLDCLKGLATDAGFLPTGAVLRMIEAGAVDSGNESDAVAIQYLRQNSGVAGMAQFQTIVTARTVPPADVAILFREIAALENTAVNELVRDAAKWFVRGTPFDVCKFRDRDMGPFPLRCIQREFRKVGCQASGAAYPSAEAAAAPSFAGLTMGAIRSQFRDLFLKMTNSSPTDLREQDDAVQACLGIQLQRPADTVWKPGPNVCRDPGIEYFVYEYGPVPPAAPTTTAPTTTAPTTAAPAPSLAPYVLGTPLPSDSCPTLETQPTLVGYYVHEASQFISSQTASEAVANIIGLLSTVPKTHRRGYLARCIIEVGDVPNTLLTVRANAKHSLRVNGVDAPLNRPIQLPRRQRNLVELQFMDVSNAFGTPLLDIQRGSDRGVLGPLLNQSIWKPMISIGMTNNRLNDLNGILCFPPTAASDLGQVLISRDLKWRLSTIGTVAMHFTLTRLPATGSNTLFRFDAGTEGASEQCLKVTLENGGFLVVTLTSTRGAFQARSKRALTGANVGATVQHVAIVPDARATQIYLNGEDITGPQTVQTPLRAPTQLVFSHLKIGPTAGATLQRFNIYNRALSSSQVARDRRMDDPTVSEDTTEIATAATTPASLGFAIQSGGRVVRAGAGTVSPIPSVRVRDSNMCARRCADQGNDCLAFQYDGRVGPDVSNCDMYKFLNTDTDTGPANEATAGLVTIGTKPHTTEPQIRFRGPPLVIDTGIVSFAACANKCVGNAACAGFTFERDPRVRTTRGTCTQFRAITRREKDPRAAFDALVSGQMSRHTDTINATVIRGGCPSGMYAFGSQGRCCATEPRGVLYDQCRKGECGMAATDTQVAACGPASA